MIKDIVRHGNNIYANFVYRLSFNTDKRTFHCDCMAHSVKLGRCRHINDFGNFLLNHSKLLSQQGFSDEEIAVVVQCLEESKQ